MANSTNKGDSTGEADSMGMADPTYITESFHEIMRNIRKPMDFFFVRHGESAGNKEGRMQGHLDRPLTQRGREQAAKTGQWFNQLQIKGARVFASPLSRAVETAQIICEHAGYDAPQILPSIKEIDTGIFEGLSFREIQDRYPEDFSRFVVNSWEAVPRAERAQSLVNRALETWRYLVGLGEQGPSTSVSVTHGGMIQWIIKTSFGVDMTTPQRWMPISKASNCGVFLMQVRPVQALQARDGRLQAEGASGYYAQWTLLNFTPGSPPDMGEQFHTDRF